MKKLLHFLAHLFRVNSGIVYSWWDSDTGYLQRGWKCSCGNIYFVEQSELRQETNLERIGRELGEDNKSNRRRNMTIEDHKSLELAGLVRNITKNLEELVSKVQLKSNIYLDEIKNLKGEQWKVKQTLQEHLDPEAVLLRFKEEILTCLEDNEFRIKVQMILGLPTEEYQTKYTTTAETPENKSDDHVPNTRKLVEAEERLEKEVNNAIRLLAKETYVGSKQALQRALDLWKEARNDK